MLNLSFVPRRTVLQCGLAAVSSVMLMSWLQIRPLGIFFLVLFTFWFYKTRCNLRIVPPPELQKKLEQLRECARDWRRNNPTMFCAVSSGCLGTLAILGHLISGSTVVLMGLVIAAILSTKYNFKIIKIDPKDFAWSDKINRDTELDEEFMLEVNESNLVLLERASDLATLSSPTDEEKSDEIPSELLIPDSIPEIDENSTDEDIDDLVPIVRNRKGERTKEDNNVVSVASSSDLIEFKKGHFKRDSSLSTTSSSSEESLSKGLQFPDHTTVDGPNLRELPQPKPSDHSQSSDVAALTQALLVNSGKLLPSLVTGMVQWGFGNSGDTENASTSASSATINSNTNSNSNNTNTLPQTHTRRVVTALDSSDDSDFEILENEDFE